MISSIDRTAVTGCAGSTLAMIARRADSATSIGFPRVRTTR